MPDLRLQVSLLKPEEAEQYMRIRHEVFRPTVNNILYARGEPSQKTLDAVTEDIREGIVNRGTLYLKCVDTSTGEMVAGARWRYVRPAEEGAKERTWEEVDAGLTTPEPFADASPSKARDYRQSIRTRLRSKRPQQASRDFSAPVTADAHHHASGFGS